MVKRNWTSKLAYFFLVSLLIIGSGCEMPWDKVTNSNATNVGGNTGGTGSAEDTINFIIPIKPIVIDGNSDDWSDIEPVLVDDINDEDPRANFDGTDLYKFYLARDNTFLYIMMTLYDGHPNTNINSAMYIFQANQSATQADSPGDRFANVFFRNGWPNVNISERVSGDRFPIVLVDYPSGYSWVGVGSNFIECKVRLYDMGALHGRYVRVYTHVVTSESGYPNYPVSDGDIYNIRLIME